MVGLIGLFQPRGLICVSVCVRGGGGGGDINVKPILITDFAI